MTYKQHLQTAALAAFGVFCRRECGGRTGPFYKGKSVRIMVGPSPES